LTLCDADAVVYDLHSSEIQVTYMACSPSLSRDMGTNVPLIALSSQEATL